MKYLAQRWWGYLLGFLLFYSPFAYFQKVIYYVSFGRWDDLSIHSFCLRIQIEHLLDGLLPLFGPIFIVGFILLLLSTIFLGPIYCGILCPTGAVTEYLSRLIPKKYQVHWQKYVDITAMRYGMLAAYVVMSFFGTAVACAYCNFYVFDLLVNYIFWGYLVSFTSSLWLTLFLWLLVFGFFTKGGRGFCLFLCPVGVLQNLLSCLTGFLPWTYRIRLQEKRCVGCNRCAQHCPMAAITVVNKKAVINPHQCIGCRECLPHCPTRAIFYGRKQYEK